MLPSKCQPSKSSRVTKHRFRPRSCRKDQRQPLKPDSRFVRIIHVRIRSTNKITPPNDNMISSGTITDNDLHFPKELGQRSTTETRFVSVTRVRRQSQPLPKSHGIPTATSINLQMSSSDFNYNQFNDRSVNTICSRPDQTLSHRHYGEVSSWKKKRTKQKNCGGYGCLCTPFCTILSLLAAALLLAIVIATILIAVLIKNNPSTSSTSTTTPSICGFSCLSQTWISSSNLLVKWSFDGTFFDDMNTYTALAVNNPSFTASGYVNQAIVLNAAANQYLYTSYIPLIGASFTVELWLYPTGFPNPTDHSILGLCTYAGNDQCLHITIRKSASSYCLYMSFFGDTCTSNGSVSLNTWTHAAFVFDKVTNAMSIYLNGQLVGSATSALPLQGTANIVTIGYIPGIVTAYGSNYFQGCMDQLTIANRPKSACEILDDATLATYYNFDNSATLNDSGPNSLLSTSQSISFVSSGHSSQAISFNDSTAYLQIGGLTGLGITNNSFSISLWIRPYSLSGTLVFVSLTAAGSGWCMSFIGFGTNGSIIAQVWTGGVRSVFGPALSTSSVWYHVVETWSSSNGLRLYIDNVLVASDTLALTYIASSGSNYVELANRPNNVCAYGAISAPASFYGDIDDFRIYSRELTVDDVCTLYHS